MPALASGYITANGTTTVNIPVPTGGKNAFPMTVALWGSLGTGTVSWKALFQDNAGVLQTGVAFPTGAAALPTAINTSATSSFRCDVLQLTLTGATNPNLGYWVG